MTVIERFNFLWLANAMITPASPHERYYYDAQGKNLFYTTTCSCNTSLVIILNSYNLRHSIETESDLAVRLEFINDKSSLIYEIPRFNTACMVDIQLQFLSLMPCLTIDYEIVEEVERQKDNHRFVLDDLLLKKKNLIIMAPYWNAFKLQTFIVYMDEFAAAVGLNFNEDKYNTF